MKYSVYGIYVDPGGELFINNNSKITVENPETEHYEFWYKDGSSGQILNSTVEYTWTPDPGGKSQFNEAGMFIKADNFEMRNSTIQYSLGNGIEAYQADSLNNRIFRVSGEWSRWYSCPKQHWSVVDRLYNKQQWKGY